MQLHCLQATKVLLQRVADGDIPGGVSGAGWGPPMGGNSPFGAFSGLSRNARPNFFTHTPCKPDWWPLKVMQLHAVQNHTVPCACSILPLRFCLL